MSLNFADQPNVTELLIHWCNGDESVPDKLFPLVYKELKAIARRHLRKESPGHTLQTTALVNEAYLRLVNQKRVHWKNRAHFLAIAAQMMRRILIDHARGHARLRRGGKMRMLSLDEALTVSNDRASELLALDDALNNLAKLDPRRGRVVELRFFGGLSNEEIGEVMQISPNTVTRDWNMARAWLYQELAR
jgi:RNA polymerase sigma-70 factor (ECF subfamily)